MSDSALPPLLPKQEVPPVIGRGSLPPLLPPVGGQPKTILFYRGWCLLFVLLYLSFCIYALGVARGDFEPSFGLIEMMVSRDNPSAQAEIVAEKRAEAPGLAVFTGLIALLYGFAAALPRRPWAWTFGLIMICSTIFPYIITAAGAVPLLLYWTKPALKFQFGCRR